MINVPARNKISNRIRALSLEARHSISREISKQRRHQFESNLFIPKSYFKTSKTMSPKSEKCSRGCNCNISRPERQEVGSNNSCRSRVLTEKCRTRHSEECSLDKEQKPVMYKGGREYDLLPRGHVVVRCLPPTLNRPIIPTLLQIPLPYCTPPSMTHTSVPFEASPPQPKSTPRLPNLPKKTRDESHIKKVVKNRKRNSLSETSTPSTTTNKPFQRQLREGSTKSGENSPERKKTPVKKKPSRKRRTSSDKIENSNTPLSLPIIDSPLPSPSPTPERLEKPLPPLDPNPLPNLSATSDRTARSTASNVVSLVKTTSSPGSEKFPKSVPTSAAISESKKHTNSCQCDTLCKLYESPNRMDFTPTSTLDGDFYTASKRKSYSHGSSQTRLTDNSVDSICKNVVCEENDNSSFQRPMESYCWEVNVSNTSKQSCTEVNSNFDRVSVRRSQETWSPPTTTTNSSPRSSKRGSNERSRDQSNHISNSNDSNFFSMDMSNERFSGEPTCRCCCFHEEFTISENAPVQSRSSYRERNEWHEECSPERVDALYRQFQYDETQERYGSTERSIGGSVSSAQQLQVASTNIEAMQNMEPTPQTETTTTATQCGEGCRCNSANEIDPVTVDSAQFESELPSQYLPPVEETPPTMTPSDRRNSRNPPRALDPRIPPDQQLMINGMENYGPPYYGCNLNPWCVPWWYHYYPPLDYTYYGNCPPASLPPQQQQQQQLHPSTVWPYFCPPQLSAAAAPPTAPTATDETRFYRAPQDHWPNS